MSMIVVMPGGFHPFHAGHFALYQSAKKAFPNADLYVAATNDQSSRPFPFALKEKLAKLAGVEPGHFVQVKSPFQCKEITQNYNPDSDVLVFVRSEKDKTEQPKPGGTKKDGSPAYFQPYTGKNLQPFSKHAYIAYLPTVEFGPGITSASEIRALWPRLKDSGKLKLVNSLYPATVKNPKLAPTVVQMFDQVMGNQGVSEGSEQEPTIHDYHRARDELSKIPKGTEEHTQAVIDIQKLLKAVIAAEKKQQQGVAEGALNEFAPDGFNGGDDDDGFDPKIAKMAQEDGFTKGVSLADAMTLERAMAINYWQRSGGIYKQYFAKGFKAGRMEKIRYNNKQYDLNLKLMKDGSIRHGEQGVAEETIHVGHRNSKGDWIKTSTHSNYSDAKKAMAELEKQGKKGVQHRYDNNGSIDPGTHNFRKVDEQGVAEGLDTNTFNDFHKWKEAVYTLNADITQMGKAGQYTAIGSDGVIGKFDSQTNQGYINSQQGMAEGNEKHECPHCHGSGRMVRDPDIGTDQECFVCDGTGYVDDEEGRLKEFAPPEGSGGNDDRSRRLRKILEIAIRVAEEQNVGTLTMIHAMNTIASDDFFRSAIEGILPDITDKEYRNILQVAYNSVKQGNVDYMEGKVIPMDSHRPTEMSAEFINWLRKNHPEVTMRDLKDPIKRNSLYREYQQTLKEFSQGGGDNGDGPDEEEILFRLAKQWWLGTEQDMIRAQRTLASMGWDIGEDEGGYDNGGVFVVRADDVNGNSYISWSHEDLSDGQLNEFAQGLSEGSQNLDYIEEK